MRQLVSFPLTKGFLILCSTGKEPQICLSKMTCCTRQTEDTLRVKAAKKIKTHIQTKYTAAKSSLLSLFDELKGKRQSTVCYIFCKLMKSTSLFALHKQMLREMDHSCERICGSKNFHCVKNMVPVGSL